MHTPPTPSAPPPPNCRGRPPRWACDWGRGRGSWGTGEGFGVGGEKAPVEGNAVTAAAGLRARRVRRWEDDEGPVGIPSSNALAL